MRISWLRGSVVFRWNVSSFSHIKYNQIPFDPIFRHAVAAVLWAKDGRVWNRDQHLGSHHAGKNCGRGGDYFLDFVLARKAFVRTTMFSIKINDTDLFIWSIRMCIWVIGINNQHEQSYGNRAGQAKWYLTFRLITASNNVKCRLVSSKTLAFVMAVV